MSARWHALSAVVCSKSAVVDDLIYAITAQTLQPVSNKYHRHTSHVSNDSLGHTLALLLVLFALTAEQAAVWQHNHSSSGLETSFFELVDPCSADVLIHAGYTSDCVDALHQTALCETNTACWDCPVSLC